MNKGWIKLHRQFLEWEWYDEPNCLRVFLHCLLRANHKDNKYRGETIKRGTFVSSLDILAFELKIGKQSLRTALGKLKKTGEINTRTNTRGTLVIVCNYDTYQDEADETNTPANTPLTRNQHTTNTQLTTNKNDKNVKNEKNEKNIVPTISEVEEYFKQTDKIQTSHIQLEAENFINHYESIDWKRNGKKIKNWKLQASTWANNYVKFNPVRRNIHENPFE
jgi:hypothetical protein